MNCWKCGREAGEGKIECAVHNTVNVTYSRATEFKLVDWSKVETLNDVKKILNIMGLRVLVGSAAWRELHEFLED